MGHEFEVAWRVIARAFELERATPAGIFDFVFVVFIVACHYVHALLVFFGQLIAALACRLFGRSATKFYPSPHHMYKDAILLVGCFCLSIVTIAIVEWRRFPPDFQLRELRPEITRSGLSR